MRCGPGEAELHGEPLSAAPVLRWKGKGRRIAAFTHRFRLPFRHLKGRPCSP